MTPTVGISGRQLGDWMDFVDDGLPTFAELCSRPDVPQPSTWGLFGADDDVGALNVLGPPEVQRGVAAARRGSVFSLDHPIGRFDSPHRPPAVHTVVDLGRGWRDDRLDNFYLQQTSQVDGLGHVAHHEFGFYNGAPHEKLVAGSPLLGVGRWAARGIVGRGVLVDVATYCDQIGRPLSHVPGDPIDVALLEATLASQHTHIERGDLLCVRTGYPAHRDGCSGPIPRGHAGLAQSYDVIEWLWDRRIPLVAGDTVALECVPTVADSPFGPTDAVDDNDRLMHATLIALMGMVIGELWDLDALASDCATDGRYEFLLVVKPLALTGGVGSPPNATAIK